jgi:glycerol dehydrogenase
MLPNLVESLGGGNKKGLLITDKFVYDNILPSLNLGSGSSFVTETFGGECTEGEIQRLVDIGTRNSVGCVIGLGGGKTIDTAKAVSAYLKVPIIIAATAASTDAPTSARAVIYNENAEVVKYLDLPSNPNVVLLDSC